MSGPVEPGQNDTTIRQGMKVLYRELILRLMAATAVIVSLLGLLAIHRLVA